MEALHQSETVRAPHERPRRFYASQGCVEIGEREKVGAHFSFRRLVAQPLPQPDLDPEIGEFTK